MTQPGQPLGMSDFFALEAGEYLERLDALLSTGGAGAGGAGPDPDEFVRLARALRGSALMASQQAIARAASGLEAVARALREGRRPWDPATQQVAVRAVDDLKIFVRRTASWSDADTAKAEALAGQLEQIAGRPSSAAGAGPTRAVETVALDAGARAFVAREGAAIASALDRAAQVLRGNPLAHDPLQQVLKALQPLRGLAALNDLPPLPDLLEGIEGAIAELGRAVPSGGGAPVAELFQAAAAAIAQAAREVAERGRPDAESAPFRQFAALAVKFMEAEPDVVPIDTLFHADAGPHIVQRGTAAARPAALGRVELVSHGEHLRQAADSLERAPSATQRELRAHTLAGTFRALAGAGRGTLADSVAQFAQAGREAVSQGTAVRAAAAFAAELRRAGDILARSGTGEETSLAAELAAVTVAVRRLETAAPAAVSPLAAPAVRPVVRPAAPPQRHAQPVAPPTPAPAQTRAQDDEAVPDSPDVIGSWAVYQRLVAAGVGPASLDELIATAAALPVTAGYRPGVSAAPRVSADPGAAPRADREPAVVDIRTLLYRGARARERAQELRQAAKRMSGDDLRAVIDEVCDLVVLALEPEA